MARFAKNKDGKEVVLVINWVKRKEADMSPGGGESPADSESEEKSQSSVGISKPGDNREVGGFPVSSYDHGLE